MTPGSSISHDPDLPWGHWMRTVAKPGYKDVIIDEHGQEWRTLRQALWCGRLNMSSFNSRIVDSNLELMLAILISKTGNIIGIGEDVAGLFDGNCDFRLWFVYWLQSTGLLRPAAYGPLEAGTTAEGASVVKLLLATRPPKLATIPVGAEAIAAFGAQGTSNECDRGAFNTPNGPSSKFPYVVLREDRFGRHMLSLLHRDPGDVIPLARTIWTVTLPNREIRDRLHRWMHHRMHSWSRWGELARRRGALALSEHLLAIIASDPQFGHVVDSAGSSIIAIDQPVQK